MTPTPFIFAFIFPFIFTAEGFTDYSHTQPANVSIVTVLVNGGDDNDVLVGGAGKGINVGAANDLFYQEAA